MIHSIKNFWKDLRYIVNSEIRAILKDKGVIVFLFLVPLAYPIIYTFIYNPEVVKEVPLVVVDNENSELSREFIRRINASESVDIIGTTAQVNTAKDMLKRHKCYGYLVIPKDFSRNIYDKHSSAKVQLICDLSSIFYYKAYMIAINDVSLSMGRDIEKQANFDTSRLVTDTKVRPVDSEFVALYNPVGGYASFLIPAVLILVLQQSTLLGVCMMVGTAREKRNKRYIDPTHNYKKGLPLRVIWGRSLVYLFILAVSSMWTLIIVPYMFDLPQLANPLDLAVFLLPFILSTIFFANTLALFVKGREEPVIFLVFTSVIFIFVMGVSWPWNSLSPFWKLLASLVPSTPAGRGFVALSSMGADITEVKSEYINLWILTLAYMLIASIGQRFLILKHRKERGK